MSAYRILLGDCRESLRTLPDASVQCCVTSPPYWGLRDYGHDGQLGLESTPDEFVTHMVEVFREVRRVLRDDGTLWLNLGDSYAAHPGQRKATDKAGAKQQTKRGSTGSPSRFVESLKAKDLVMIPARVAMALQADGWYLRSDIIWAKPNPMPESVTDRPTKAHEYLFLLSKSERYYYDADAIAEPAVSEHASGNGFARPQQISRDGRGSTEQWLPPSQRPQRVRAEQLFRERGLTEAHREAIRAVGMADAGKALRTMSGAGRNAEETQRLADEAKAALGGYFREFVGGDTRNARSVWTIATQPYKGAHFATFPPELAERCIKAGSKPGDVVLDPFAGSGTTGMVATGHGRSAILCELNPAYADLIRERCGPMLEAA